MANAAYIERLQQVIFHLHNSGSIHLGTVPVEEVFHGKTLWKGNVEIFELTEHPKATHCYGWTYGEPEEFIIILGISPVTDVKSAVKAGVSYQINMRDRNDCSQYGRLYQ